MIKHLDVDSPVIEGLKSYWDSIMEARNLPQFFEYFGYLRKHVIDTKRAAARKGGEIPARPNHMRWRKPRRVANVLSVNDSRMAMFKNPPPSKFASFDQVFIEFNCDKVALDFATINQAIAKAEAKEKPVDSCTRKEFASKLKSAKIRSEKAEMRLAELRTILSDGKEEIASTAAPSNSSTLGFKSNWYPGPPNQTIGYDFMESDIEPIASVSYLTSDTKLGALYESRSSEPFKPP